jgi:hypothetical protein
LLKLQEIINDLYVAIFYESKEGDLYLLLSKALKEYIPITESFSQLSPVHVKTKFKKDKHGIIIRVYGNKFFEIDTFLKSKLGKPSSEVDKNNDGFPQAGFYGDIYRGLHLQYYLSERFTEIVCIGNCNGS